MDTLISASGASLAKHTAPRRVPGTPAKDLLAAARDGSVQDVESALTAVKKANGNVNTRNAFGSTALHIAVWRNHVPIVRRLLAAGADPDARDGESGWSSLHRALHFGHLAVSGVLIEAGASLFLEDSKGRTPIDLISGPVQQCIRGSADEGATEVYSWGNGFNYQLGTGTSGIQRKPCRVDTLAGLDIKSVAAAKFHSVALGSDGSIYSWGFGRGGRLGHPDFDIHSGQVAVITPRQVVSGLGARRVTAVAVAKHHTIIALDSGEVYTWGSNREGQLGYAAVDTQPTPRRVSTLKARVSEVAAANKHSAVLTDVGEVFTWGCNAEGQLGYGTSNSSANFIPRCVDYLKGRKFLSISASKYHTVVLGSEGEVYTWGYKMVTPRRVLVTRNTKKAGSLPLKFHRIERLHIVAIAAGMKHSSVISEDGSIFYWASGDENLRCRQLLAMGGHQVVAVAAGKYRTSVATADGSVFIWDGENMKGDDVPLPMRVHGMKHATSLSVGENHSLVIASLYVPIYPPKQATEMVAVNKGSCDLIDEGGDDTDLDEDMVSLTELVPSKIPSPVPSLKDLCQDVIIGSLVEPKNVLHVLEIAEALGADNLRRYCEDLVLHNLGYVLSMSSSIFGQLRPALLADLEKTLDASSVQAWSHHQLPTPSATLPAVVDSEEEGSNSGERVRGVFPSDARDQTYDDRAALVESIMYSQVVDQDIMKQLRAIRKKLQQIEALEMKLAKGQSLDDQQYAKLRMKQDLEQSLQSLESGVLPKLATDNHEASDKSQSSDQRKSQDSEYRRRTGKKKKKKHSEDFHTQATQLENSKPTPPLDSTSMLPQYHLPAPVTRFSSDSKDNTSSGSWLDAKAKLLEERSLSRPRECDYPKSRQVQDRMSSSSSHPPAREFKEVWGGPNELPHQMKHLSTLDSGSMSTKKKVKKGGLSMFLSGALEAPPKVMVPRAEGPAWGGVRVPKVLDSLREIQTEQTAEGPVQVLMPESLTVTGLPSAEKASLGAITGGGKRVQWTPFVRASDPIAVVPVSIPVKSTMENSPPPWSGSSTGSVRSLRDIQLEQGKHKASQRGNPWGSPQLSSPLAGGGPVLTLDHTSSTESPNRWYKPDEASPSSLRCIQIEEQAMKELRRIYKNVKLVMETDR